MTKKEVAAVKEVIYSLKEALDDPAPMYPLTQEQRIDFEARIDGLVWLLKFSGKADDLDPCFLAEEFVD